MSFTTLVQRTGAFPAKFGVKRQKKKKKKKPADNQVLG